MFVNTPLRTHHTSNIYIYVCVCVLLRFTAASSYWAYELSSAPGQKNVDVNCDIISNIIYGDVIVFTGDQKAIRLSGFLNTVRI